MSPRPTRLPAPPVVRIPLDAPFVVRPDAVLARRRDRGVVMRVGLGWIALLSLVYLVA